MNLIFSPETIFLFLCFLGLLSVILWWLILIQKKKEWLPVLKILLEKKVIKKRWKHVKPPFIPFIIFSFLVMTYLFLFLQPSSLTFTTTELSHKRVHVFFDMSPSVSSRVSIAEYLEKAKQVFDLYTPNNKVTFSTSHNASLFSWSSWPETEDLIKKLGFHAGGLQFEKMLKAQQEEIKGSALLVVFSDNDTHSWGNFYWKFFDKNMFVSLFYLGPPKDGNNVFFNEVKHISFGDEKRSDWDVKIERNTLQGVQKGLLKATFQGKDVASEPWSFAEAEHTLSLRVSIPRSMLSTKDSQQKNDVANVAQDSFLEWSLVPQVLQVSQDSSDLMRLDNVFRVPLVEPSFEVLLMAENRGEKMIEDMAYPLESVFEVLGIKVNRLDQKPLSFEHYQKSPLWIALSEEQDFCPQLGDLKDKKSSIKKQLWMAVSDFGKSYQNLCMCYDKLIVKNSSSYSPSIYCRESLDRNSFNRVMASLGAKQIGGEISDEKKSIGWSGINADGTLEMLVFNVPLRPSRLTGITYGSWPLLVRQLLQIQGFISPEAEDLSRQSWPRLNDMSEAQEKAFLSNVPLEESRLKNKSLNELPLVWDQHTMSHKEIPQGLSQEQRDSSFWVMLCVSLVLALTFLELLFFIWKNRERKERA